MIIRLSGFSRCKEIEKSCYLFLARSRRSDSGARAKTKASERAGKNEGLALHYLNAWNRLICFKLTHLGQGRYN